MAHTCQVSKNFRENPVKKMKIFLQIHVWSSNFQDIPCSNLTTLMAADALVPAIATPSSTMVLTFKSIFKPEINIYLIKGKTESLFKVFIIMPTNGWTADNATLSAEAALFTKWDIFIFSFKLFSNKFWLISKNFLKWPQRSHRSMSSYCIHYNDVIMSSVASQITSRKIVYSTVYSGADQTKHQSSTSLAFVRRIHRWIGSGNGLVPWGIKPLRGPVFTKISDIWHHEATMS